MNIKKITAAVLTALIFGSAAKITGIYRNSESSAYAAEVSQGKPLFSIDSVQIYEKDVQKGRPCRVTLSVEGADKLYCSTQLFLYYDSKLKISGNAVPGTAVSELVTTQMKGDTGDFIFLSTAGSDDSGTDGDMWNIDFILPQDAKPGDEFKVYMGDSKYGRIKSIFTNFNDDADGEAMTSHIFSVKPSATIKVAENPPYVLGDFNDDGIINAVDASSILTYYAGYSVDRSIKLTNYEMGCGDVNKDGVVNGVDASVVLTYYAYVSAKGGMSFTDYLAGVRF